MEARVVGLGVEPAGPALRGEERAAAQSLGRLHVEEAGQGGEEVDQPHGGGDARPAPGRAGKLHEEGHVEGPSVEQDAVVLLPVLAQALAVVGEDDHDRAVVDPPLAQLVEEEAHRLVGRGDLAVVGEEAREPGGRLVGGVGLVDVEEEEEGTVGDPRQPLEGDAGGLRPGPLHEAEGVRPRRSEDAVVVEVEALAEAASTPQHPGRHRGPGGVAPGLEEAGQRRAGAVQAIAQVVAHAVLERQETGQHRGVGGKREGDVAVGALEEDGVPAEAVEVGGGTRRVPVGRKVVRAEGVDRDEDERRAREARAGPLPGAASQGSEGEQHERRPDHGAHPGHSRSRAAPIPER